MKAKEKLMKDIDYVRRRISESVSKMDAVNVNLIAEAFPQGHWNYGVFYELEFCLPFDFALIENFKKFMAEQFVDEKITYESLLVWGESSQAGHFLHYINFEVSFRTGREGTTCVLNKIGEETKIVPIFEVICAEGAKES